MLKLCFRLKLNVSLLFNKELIWEKQLKERETYGFGNINHRCLIFAWSSSLSNFFGDEGPQLVSVDSWAMFPVSLQVEHSHTGLTVESWMTIGFQSVVKTNTLLFGLTICSSWFFRDAYHQQDLYHLAIFYVFQFFRDPWKFFLSCVSSSSIWRPIWWKN